MSLELTEDYKMQRAINFGASIVVLTSLLGGSFYLGKNQRDPNELTIVQVSGPSCNYDEIRQAALNSQLRRLDRRSIAAMTGHYEPGSPLSRVAKMIVLDVLAAKRMLTNDPAYLEGVFAEVYLNKGFGDL